MTQGKRASRGTSSGIGALGSSSSNLNDDVINDAHQRLIALTNFSQRERGLIQIEESLQEQIDDDFFQDPKTFNSLKRVTDVLGSQLLDARSGVPAGSRLDSNPAYLALKKQQDIVEDAIEYMSVKHCSELHQSVAAVGKVARDLDESMDRVQRLRRQVRDIKENLGAQQRQAAIEAHVKQQRGEPTAEIRTNGSGQVAGSSTNGGRSNSVSFGDAPAGANANATNSILKQSTMSAATPSASSSISLRELWLKKLECEAVLSLLGKMEIIRDAPSTVDFFLNPPTKWGKFISPIRVGAATKTLMNAISTMFNEDVAQIQALTKVNEQLMTRKQRLEEMIWDSIHDVLYLRTGNSSSEYLAGQTRWNAGANGGTSGTNAGNASFLQDEDFYSFTNMTLEELYHQSDDESSEEEGDEPTLLGEGTSGNSRTFTTLNYNPNYPYRMIPFSLLKDVDFDLQQAELTCLEDNFNVAANNLMHHSQQPVQVFGGGGGGAFEMSNRFLPRYSDATLATRVLIESLAQLGRLDEVERYLLESIQREIRRVVEVQQGRTFVRMEKRRLQRMRVGMRHANAKTAGPAGTSIMDGGSGGGTAVMVTKEQPFRHHWRSLLHAFERVMLRLSHLAQILRFRISSDPQMANYHSSSSPLQSVLAAADQAMNRELVVYLKSCMKSVDMSQAVQESKKFERGGRIKKFDLDAKRGGGSESASATNPINPASRSMVSGQDSLTERGVFSLGIITEHPGALQHKKAEGTTSLLNDTSYAKLLSTKAAVMEMPTEQFVLEVLFPRMNSDPQVRYALTFRRSLAKWTTDLADIKRELATISGEKTVPTYNTNNRDPLEDPEGALQFLDAVIQKKLLPVLQEDAVHSTTSALEREDAFMPVFKNSIYSRGGEVEQPLCVACQVLLDATGPLFSALHRLPKGGELYMPLVAVLEHAVLAFVSRAKQRVRNICGGKKADDLLGEYGNVKNKSGLSVAMEQRRAFSLLMSEYSYLQDGSNDHDDLASVVAGSSAMLPLSPSVGDTKAKYDTTKGVKKGTVGSLSKFNPHDEENALQQELSHLQTMFRFQSHKYGDELLVCTDDELTFAACLAHSLLKLASFLERRLKSKLISQDSVSGPTRQLREAINAIKAHGVRVAKFCRIDVLVHTVAFMSKICRTYSLLTADAIRLPPCVNELGEYLTNISDILRESGGNSVTAYALSSLEQYLPLLLMESVRYIGKNDGRMRKCVITLKGIESLDRSGAVLYRDLKNATSFDGSFWDDAAAGDSFERSASFVSLLELDMDELEEYCRKNRNEFSDADYSLMFSMNCPRRQGDVRKYYDLKDKSPSKK